MQQDLIGAEVIGYMALTSQYNVSITSNEETFVFSEKKIMCGFGVKKKL